MDFPSLNGCETPLFGTFNQRLNVLGPIMQRCGIKVCAVGPNQGANFRIKLDLIEHGQVP